MLSLAPRARSQITEGGRLQEKLGNELERMVEGCCLGTEAGEYAQGCVAISGRGGHRKQSPATVPVSSALTGPLISNVTCTDGTKRLLMEYTSPC